MIRFLCVLSALFILPLSVAAQEGQTGFIKKISHFQGEERKYQIFLPEGYTPDVKWPVILYLHGGGSTGSDGDKQVINGIGEAVRLYPERFPAIVIFPQLKRNSRWAGTETDLAMSVLADIQKEYSTDLDRIYLTGLSRGAGGVYYIAYRHAEKFAAILAACGRVKPHPNKPRDGVEWLNYLPTVPDQDDPYPFLAERMKETPTWIFHGDADQVVTVEESRNLYKALSEINAPVTYSELPGVNHNSWDAAYQSEEVIQWLFKQSISNR